MNFTIRRQILNNERNHLIRSGVMYEIILIHEGNCLVQTHNQIDPCGNTQLILMKPQETISLQNNSMKKHAKASPETSSETFPVTSSGTFPVTSSETFPVTSSETFPVTLSEDACVYISLRISEETLAELSDDTFSFPPMFSFVPYQTAIIHCEARQAALLYNLLTRIADPDSDGIHLGNTLYQKSLLTSFLILFLRACMESDHIHTQHLKKEFLLDDLFGYISHHLADDLSLSALEKHFYVSGEHISRKFHQNTGTTLHQYITTARIDLSRKYLLQGYPVKDIYPLCGFESYTHFFRAFKKITGMTPMEYYKKEGQAPSE